METFLAFSTQSNAFTAWDLSLLNSLKDKRHARTLSPPPSLSLFILQPVALMEGSYLTRKLHCSCLSSEPSWWSFILLFEALLCPLALVLCVGMSFISKPIKSLCWALLLWVVHSVCCIGTRFVTDNRCKIFSYREFPSIQIKWESLWLYMRYKLFNNVKYSYIDLNIEEFIICYQESKFRLHNLANFL